MHLAFDLGAETGRAILGSVIRGKLAIREIHRFPTGILSLNGRKHWNVFRIFEEMKKSLSICAADGTVPDSIGVDSWGVDFALLDGSGDILGLPYSYRDGRTAGAMESFFKKIPVNGFMA
jgi:rhamnulokinase